MPVRASEFSQPFSPHPFSFVVNKANKLAAAGVKYAARRTRAALAK